MKDTITTANGKTGITFQDDTKVQITEHSKNTGGKILFIQKLF